MPKRNIIIDANFFNRPTSSVARELLGKYLVRRIGRKKLSGMIVEVEVYDGFRDRGSHAFRGKTIRNRPMFGDPGYWYVYFTYGMHWMLNIVTRESGYPAAILIRSLDNISGPGRLTRKFYIDGSFNSKLAVPHNKLWIEDRGVILPSSAIKNTGRIGIQYAGSYWVCRRWRFLVSNRAYSFGDVQLTKKIKGARNKNGGGKGNFIKS